MTLIRTFITIVLLGFAMNLFAHTSLVSSYPAKGQMLTKSPKQLSLNYGKKLLLLKVSLTDGANKVVAINFKATPDLKKSFKISLPTLKVDNYTVNWTAMGRDGHKMSGNFDFMVHKEGMKHSKDHKHSH